MLSRLYSLFRRKRLDRDLDLELDHHLESLEAEYRTRGLSETDARQAARRDFGNRLIVQETYRDQRGIPVLETVLQNIRFSLRSVGRTPVMTVAVIATLAIGIGANTAVFSIVNGILIKPLPYPDSDRLITVAHAAPGIRLSDSRDVGSALFLYFIEREQTRTLDGLGLFGEGRSTVTGNGEPEEIRRLFVTADILKILGIKPLQGRIFSESDDSPGSRNAVILSYGYWQRRFGGDTSVIGRKFTMADESWDIIGVLPREFRFLTNTPDVITPFRFDRKQVSVGGYFRRSIARLKPGVTLEEASADIARLIPIAIDSFPLGPGTTTAQVEGARLAPSLRPVKEVLVGDVGNTLWIVMGFIGLVLLIACANVANLLLVRAEGRQQELTIRAALGAGWRRIALELFTESTLLGIMGGLLGIGFAYGALRALLTLAPTNLPRLEEISIDPTVLMFTLGVSLFAGLLFGVFPVVRYARLGSATALPGGRVTSVSRERLRVRSILVVTQVAMAMVLLVSAGLMIRTFQKLNDVNPGFEKNDIQTVQLAFPQSSDPGVTMRAQKNVLDRLKALPGVEAAAYTSAPPMGGGFTADLLVPEGKTFSATDVPRARQFRFVSPDLFGTLKIPLVAGRDITWQDVYDKRPVVLVTENLARSEWGTAKEALGKRIRGVSTADEFREIVGVTGDVRDWAMNRPFTETVYVPALADRIFSTPTFVFPVVTYTIRTARAGTPGFLNEIRQAVWSVNPNMVIHLRTMADFVADSMARTSLTLVTLAIAASMALLLGVIGIYGVISYAVTQRTKEVGIRMALGAQSRQVRGMFLRQGFLMTALGIGLGLGGAAALTQPMAKATLLFGISPLDPATYAGVALVIGVAAGLAIYFPTRRATRVSPIQSLRAE